MKADTAEPAGNSQADLIAVARNKNVGVSLFQDGDVQNIGRPGFQCSSVARTDLGRIPQHYVPINLLLFQRTLRKKALEETPQSLGIFASRCWAANAKAAD